MAPLSSALRLEIRVQWAERICSREEPFPLNKADTDAAIAALDDWIDQNAAGVNQALPLPARTELTPAQKNELFSLVSLRRYGGP